MKMNCGRTAGWLALTILLVAMTPALRSQNKGSSIEESWNQAEKTQQEARQRQQTTPPQVPPSQTPPAQEKQVPQPMEDGPDQRPPVWDKQAPNTNLPWPYLPPQPTQVDYYNANIALIDSLSNLYCVSAVYLRNLRNRNDAAQATATPPPPPQTSQNPDFQYDKQQQPPPPVLSSDASKTLNDELFQLLKKCLDQ